MKRNGRFNGERVAQAKEAANLLKTLRQDGYKSFDDYDAHKATMPNSTPTYVMRGKPIRDSIVDYS
jgi:hypothetical protein